MGDFTPLSGFAGGLLIGLGAIWLLLASGRIAGISGVLGGVFTARGSELNWRLAFLVGLLAGPWLVVAIGYPRPVISPIQTPGLLLLGGLLVGFGTRLGNGCTSGHGVCGLARGSRRSLVATVIFFGVAVATALLLGTAELTRS